VPWPALNLKTAKALGVKISDDLLSLADVLGRIADIPQSRLRISLDLSSLGRPHRRQAEQVRKLRTVLWREMTRLAFEAG